MDQKSASKAESWSTLQNALLTALALSLLGLAGLTYVTFNTLDILKRQQEQWYVFENVIDQKAALISDLRGALGYGGLIHNYKNLVLHRDKTRIPEIEENLDTFQDVVTRYIALLPDATEATALDEIQTTVDRYHRRFLAVVARLEQGPATVAELDAIAHVDDLTALSALEHLQGAWLENSFSARTQMVEAMTKGRSLIGVIPWIVPTMAVLIIVLVWLMRRLNVAIDGRRQESEQRQRYQAELVEERDRVAAQAEKLREFTETLTEAREELENLNDQKTKLFSIIAHDLRGPFTVVVGHAKLLASGVVPADRVTESGEAMHRASERVYGLLENLLEWARLQMENVEFAPEPVAVGDVVETAMAPLRDVAERKGVTLEHDLPPVSIVADRYMAETVIRNLVANAIKFSHRGDKVRVTEAGGAAPPDRLGLAVSDQGVGMDAEQLAAVTRVGESRSTAGTDGEAGSGLGIVLCKEMVERHDGELLITSEPGEGTVVTVDFARADPSPGSAET